MTHQNRAHNSSFVETLMPHRPFISKEKLSQVTMSSIPRRSFRSSFMHLGFILTTALADPFINGTWTPIAAWPISPIHMILLSSGKVLTYGKSPTIADGDGFHYDVWDPRLGLFNSSSHRTLPTQTRTDIFCSGQVNIPGTEGDVLIMGGSQVVNGVRNSGTTHTQIFDSRTESLYLTGNNMHEARWYPTVTVLSDGNIVAQVRKEFPSLCKSSDSCCPWGR
jgi:hypothetical protein